MVFAQDYETRRRRELDAEVEVDEDMYEVKVVKVQPSQVSAEEYKKKREESKKRYEESDSKIRDNFEMALKDYQQAYDELKLLGETLGDKGRSAKEEKDFRKNYEEKKAIFHEKSLSLSMAQSALTLSRGGVGANIPSTVIPPYFYNPSYDNMAYYVQPLGANLMAPNPGMGGSVGRGETCLLSADESQCTLPDGRVYKLDKSVGQMERAAGKDLPRSVAGEKSKKATATPK